MLIIISFSFLRYEQTNEPVLWKRRAWSRTKGVHIVGINRQVPGHQMVKENWLLAIRSKRDGVSTLSKSIGDAAQITQSNKYLIIPIATSVIADVRNEFTRLMEKLKELFGTICTAERDRREMDSQNNLHADWFDYLSIGKKVIFVAGNWLYFFLSSFFFRRSRRAPKKVP